ncbi:sigma-54-dependent Fis family transcriptional regulator [Gordonia crocea]|uniref:Fis family transcriptional regulator n=1 Tax=Gordonia crocea TaxID=589162 RepID=A0A7I9UWZ7_9ACTN|nr:helix-turn-helix domain-containing protein [Gordonia crocea]GED97724.1 Fis family transcriptional regulator [Gordonia crocea]
MSKSQPGRTVIEASWRRSQMSGLAPDDRPDVAVTDTGAADPLLDAARPVLQRAADELTDTGTALLLVDHECQLVSRVASGVAIERTLLGLGATTGAVFAEDVVGTTALGTPAEIRSGVTVNGTEHYLEQFKKLSCFGRPIVHPATRRLAGIICLTEISPTSNPLSAPFVNRLVAGIEDRLLDRSRAEHRAVIEAFSRAAPRRDAAVAAIGDDLQLTNSLAAALLSPADFGTLGMLVSEHGTRADPVLTLSSGVTVRVVVERVPGVGRAAIFRLHPTPSATPFRAVPIPTPRSSPAATAITGEPGTGRSRAARAQAGPHVLADVSDGMLTGNRLDLVALLARVREESATLVVDDADMLDDSSVHLLRKAITNSSPDTPPLVVVTGPVSTARPAIKALVAACPRRTDLPPLRQRSGDIVALAHDFLAQTDPRLELSAAAADALASAEWPGNLAELAVVAHAAAAATTARASRLVDLDDLPPQYRAVTRAARLGGLEQAERQAIIDALEASDNNKVRAAKALGVSRTTLYTRIRALGIRG